MDFGALPPEINSARMYAGPGSGPLLAAAAAWDALCEDLYSTAVSYNSIVSALSGATWLGPSSASMAAAAATYVAWMSSTAGQAEQAAGQARAAAAAYQTAFAMTVPPPVIAANRARLAALVATNFLGQNTPAIAAAQAEYAEMWAQDTAAMYGYAGSSATATQLTPFTPPAPTTKAVPAAQSAALTQAAGSPVQAAISTVPQLVVSAVPQALQSLANPMPSSSPLVNLLDSLAPYAGVVSDALGTVDSALSTEGTVAQAEVLAEGGTAVGGPALLATGGVGSGTGALAGDIKGATSPSASLGGAGRAGALSVPPGWTAAALMARPLDTVPGTTFVAEPTWTGMPPAMWSALPMAQLAGRGGVASSRTYQYDNQASRANRSFGT